MSPSLIVPTGVLGGVDCCRFGDPLPETTLKLPNLSRKTLSMRARYWLIVADMMESGNGNFLLFEGSAVLPKLSVSGGLIGAPATVACGVAVLAE